MNHLYLFRNCINTASSFRSFPPQLPPKNLVYKNQIITIFIIFTVIFIAYTHSKPPNHHRVVLHDSNGLLQLLHGPMAPLRVLRQVLCHQAPRPRCRRRRGVALRVEGAEGQVEGGVQTGRQRGLQRGLGIGKIFRKHMEKWVGQLDMDGADLQLSFQN